MSRLKNRDDALELMVKAQQDLSLVDCLSTPLTICYCMDKLKMKPILNIPELNIVCIGVSTKAEGRVFTETNCWNEFIYFLGYKKQLVHIWFVGPEMDEVDCNPINENNHVPLIFHCFKGTVIEFFRCQISLLRSPTIVVGVNCGFGNWENFGSQRFDLLQSWLPDLYFLTSTSLPLFFTCANDYADLQGEIKVMYHILGAKFVARGEENPFSYASTFIPPEKDPTSSAGTESNYSRGNSFWYAVQGFDRNRRRKVEGTGVTWLACIADIFQPISDVDSRCIPLVDLTWRWYIPPHVPAAAPVPALSRTSDKLLCPSLDDIEQLVKNYSAPAVSPNTAPAIHVLPLTTSASGIENQIASRSDLLGPLTITSKQTVTVDRLRLEISVPQTASLRGVDAQLADSGYEVALMLSGSTDVLRISLFQRVVTDKAVEAVLKGKGKNLLIFSFLLATP